MNANLCRYDYANSLKQSQEDEQRRRRLSVMLHMQSWKIQSLAQEKLDEKKRMIEEENIRLQEQDWEDLNRAKKEQLEQEKLDRLKGGMIF